MVQSNAPAPLLIVVGLGFLAGAAALAWFSALTTVTATRTTPTSVDVLFVDRMFGVVESSGERIAGVRAARSTIPRPEGSTSRTSTTRFLVFDTANGQVFAGPRYHWFERHADAIKDFVADPSRSELVLRKSDDGRELMRFLFAQLGVVFLALLGGLATWLGIRKLFPDPYAGVGPR